MDDQESKFEVFFDGKCTLCAKEMAMLRKWDRHDRILFSDFTEPSFDFESTGKSYDDLMEQIHGRTASGQWVIGVDVFRELYSRVGWNRMVWLSKVPIVRTLLTVGYRAFAKWRLWWHRDRCVSDRCKVRAFGRAE